RRVHCRPLVSRGPPHRARPRPPDRAAQAGAAPRAVRASGAAGRRVTPSEKLVRVAAGQGFWGDWLEAPRRQGEGGPVDYLMLDYLAEVTMFILQKRKEWG